jgi:hypothetical protein
MTRTRRARTTKQELRKATSPKPNMESPDNQPWSWSELYATRSLSCTIRSGEFRDDQSRQHDWVTGTATSTDGPITPATMLCVNVLA